MTTVPAGAVIDICVMGDGFPIHQPLVRAGYDHGGAILYFNYLWIIIALQMGNAITEFSQSIGMKSLTLVWMLKEMVVSRSRYGKVRA